MARISIDIASVERDKLDDEDDDDDEEDDDAVGEGVVELRERCMASERCRVSVRIRMLVVSVEIDCPPTHTPPRKYHGANGATPTATLRTRRIGLVVANESTLEQARVPLVSNEKASRYAHAHTEERTEGAAAGACAAPAAKFTRFGRFESHDDAIFSRALSIPSLCSLEESGGHQCDSRMPQEDERDHEVSRGA